MPDDRPNAEELYEHLVNLEIEYGKQVQPQPQTTENGTDDVSLMLIKGSALLKGSSGSNGNINKN